MTQFRPDRRTATLGLLALGAAGCQSQVGAPPISEDAMTQPSWSAGVDLPFPMQEIYPCLHNWRIHQAGGFIAEGGQITGPTAAHYSWAPDEAAWTKEAELPTARHHPQLVSFDGRLLAIGGFEARSAGAVWVMQSTGWQMHDGDWLAAPELPLPCGEAVTGVTGDGALHLAGGRTPAGASNASWNDQADTTHHYVLSGFGGRWETAAPCLTPRNSAAAAIIDGDLYVVGGRQVNGGNLAMLEIYDHSEDRWRTGAPMPQAQGGLAAAAIGDRLYAFGGEFFEGAGGVYPECWVYDQPSDNWSALPDMPRPRHGLGAVALGNRIYIIGGALQRGGSQTSAALDVLTI